MKRNTILALIVLLLFSSSVALAASVTPVASENMDYADAAHICVTQLGFDWGLKIEAWGGPGGDRDMNGSYSGAYDSKGMLHEDFENVITISGATRYGFDWASAPYAIGAVVVQGGPMDNIFFYNPAVNSDDDLYPYSDETQMGKKETISHINFCWNKTGENPEDPELPPVPVCYQDETAWAANGDLPGEIGYVDASQWATYVEYFDVEKTVTLFAGQTIPIGTATFYAPENGWVTIAIDLVDGWIFYYDLADEEEDDNLKVQDYEFPPEGNPAIGLFDWKAVVPFGSSTGEIDVPVNNFYGVHLDVAYEYDCDVPPED